MKIIVLEEHFQIAALQKAVAAFLPGGQDTSQRASYALPTYNSKIWVLVACKRWG